MEGKETNVAIADRKGGGWNKVHNWFLLFLSDPQSMTWRALDGIAGSRRWTGGSRGDLGIFRPDCGTSVWVPHQKEEAEPICGRVRTLLGTQASISTKITKKIQYKRIRKKGKKESSTLVSKKLLRNFSERVTRTAAHYEFTRHRKEYRLSIGEGGKAPGGEGLSG